MVCSYVSASVYPIGGNREIAERAIVCLDAEPIFRDRSEALGGGEPASLPAAVQDQSHPRAPQRVLRTGAERAECAARFPSRAGRGVLLPDPWRDRAAREARGRAPADRENPRRRDIPLSGRCGALA